VPEILTQKDLDALILSLLDSEKEQDAGSKERGSAPGRKPVRVYDFRRPDKFSRDQIRTVEMLHENIARLCSTYVAAQVRAMTTIAVSSVDAMTFEEFAALLPSPGYIATINMEPLKGQMFISLDIPVALVMVDRLFGGPGLVRDVGRGLTEIEVAIVNKLLDGILSSVREGWSVLAAVTPKLDSVAQNPSFLQNIAASEMTVVIKYDMKVGKALGSMTFCIPFMALEPVLPRLSARAWFGSPRHAPGKTEMETLLSRLKAVDVSLSVELGHACLCMRDVLEMEPGDVIELESRATGPVKVLVEGRPKFLATPGRAGKRLCIRIESLIKEDPHE
jgi:flagellar motor switch protein FliM